MTSQTVQKLPITVWQDGLIRVKGTRLLADTIIYAHKSGECPKGIVESFPSNVYSVADIYSIVAYYLKNKARLDKYLDKCEAEALKIRNKVESTQVFKEKNNKFINNVNQ